MIAQTTINKKTIQNKAGNVQRRKDWRMFTLPHGADVGLSIQRGPMKTGHVPGFSSSAHTKAHELDRSIFSTHSIVEAEALAWIGLKGAVEQSISRYDTEDRSTVFGCTAHIRVAFLNASNEEKTLMPLARAFSGLLLAFPSGSYRSAFVRLPNGTTSPPRLFTVSSSSSER